MAGSFPTTGPAVESLLRQLRDGFMVREGRRSPVCVAWIGMRAADPPRAGGARAPHTIPYDSDDLEYALGLGLLRRGPYGAEAANPLVREVLARQLLANVQATVPKPRRRA